MNNYFLSQSSLFETLFAKQQLQSMGAYYVNPVMQHAILAY